MRIREVPLLQVWLSWSLHVLNAVWISRIFYLSLSSQQAAVNYLADGTIIFAILFCIAFHILRWKSVSVESDGRAFGSSIALGAAIRQVSEKMYDGFGYLIKPIPNDRVLRECATEVLKSGTFVQAQNNLDLMRIMIRIKGFIFYHLICFLFCVIGLALGSALNYGINLKNTIVFIPFFMCILANLLIYSASILLFLLLNFKDRDQ